MSNAENVVILDSEKTLSESETRSLFSNCGEILAVCPFSLPLKSLREFPGLSQYFIQFSNSQSANAACQIFVPAELKVDLLTTVPELSELFMKTSQESQKITTERKKRTRRSRRPPRKRLDNYDRIAVISCLRDHQISDIFYVHEFYSNCGSIVEIHPYSPDNFRVRYFFIEFAKKEEVDCAKREECNPLPYKVFSLAENKRFVKRYRKCAKPEQKPVSKEGLGESDIEQGFFHASSYALSRRRIK